MDSQTSYLLIRNSMCDEFNLNHKTTFLWESLKKSYDKKIESKRALSKVKNLEDLINLLEKRYIVSENKVDELKNISDWLEIKTPTLIQHVNKHKDKFGKSDCLCSVGNIAQPNPSSTLPPSIVHPPEDPEFNQARKYVCKNIGKKWKNFARELFDVVGLEIKESDLDDIEDRYKSSEERSIQVIRQWREEVGKKATTEKFLMALKKCGRFDLVEDINDGNHKS